MNKVAILDAINKLDDIVELIKDEIDDTPQRGMRISDLNATRRYLYHLVNQQERNELAAWKERMTP